MNTDNESTVATQANNTDRVEVTNIVPKKKNRGCITGIVLFFLFLLIVPICAFASFLAFGLTVSDSSDLVVATGSEDVIAVINIDGVIADYSDSVSFGGTSTSSSDQIVEDIDRAMNDSAVKAIIVEIESPGGEVVPSDIIYRKLIEARKIKPVIAYSATMAASGGYYVASAADQFIVHPSVMTGSIGVILQITNTDGLYDKLGIEVATFKTGAYKDTELIFDDNSDGEAEEIFQTMIDEAYDDFINSIVAGRGMDKDELIQLADGRIYTGYQAVENGLADATGYFEDAVLVAEDLAGIQNATVIEYQRSEDFFSLLMSKYSISNVLGLSNATVPAFGMYYLPSFMK